mmetsp:Transcript_27556/g.77942  ORF Transcript_27556/g.77942 Transcript_27556/m.77942 type:complete len:385 (+) Transcript_27556:3-1157(+)
MAGHSRAALALLGCLLLLSGGSIDAQSPEPHGGGACAAQDGSCLERGAGGSSPVPAADHLQPREIPPGTGAKAEMHLLQLRQAGRKGPVDWDDAADKVALDSRRLSSLATSMGRQYALAESQVAHVEDDGIAVVVPGLGDEARANNVARDIWWLKQQGIPFECWIFIYNLDPEFPASPSRFEPCKLVRHAGFWMSHMLAMPLNLTAKPWILHLMDGISPRPDVSLPRMLKIMELNGLGHAAPTFDAADPTCIVKGGNYTIVHRHQSYPVGRFVDFIEMHIDMFSRAYFACLQDVINTDNFLGWGMDLLLASLCGGAVPGSSTPPSRNLGAMGLLDQMTMSAASVDFRMSYDQGDARAGEQRYLDAHPGVPWASKVALGGLRAAG